MPRLPNITLFAGEIPPDFWQITTCKGECVLECTQYTCALSLGVHSVLCRLVKYNNMVKQLGDVAELIVPQVSHVSRVLVT